MRLAECKRTWFVEENCTRPRDFFKRDRPVYDDIFAGGTRETADKSDRCGNKERARRRDDQNGERSSHFSGVEIGDSREEERDRSEWEVDPFRELHHARLMVLGFIHQMHDFHVGRGFKSAFHDELDGLAHIYDTAFYECSLTEGYR